MKNREELYKKLREIAIEISDVQNKKYKYMKPKRTCLRVGCDHTDCEREMKQEICENKFCFCGAPKKVEFLKNHFNKPKEEAIRQAVKESAEDMRKLAKQTGHSRILKFRAWDKEKKVMREVEQIKLNERKIVCLLYYLNELKYDEVELMQFTGLHDKNGKEIYEGDVLSNRLKNGVVQWNEKYCAWFCSDIHQMLGDGVYEVIGNIYKNPELL